MNPKDKVGKTKLPLWIFPPIAVIYGTLALVEGGIKYSPFNWRKKPISSKEYISALDRHVQHLKSGQTVDNFSKVEILGHIIATAAIMLDAEWHGTLIDDAPKGSDILYLMEDLREHPVMKQLQEKGFAELPKEEEECQTTLEIPKQTDRVLYKKS